MLKKSFKIRSRTGGIRRKISKEHARIMMYSNPINTHQNDSCIVSSSDIIEGSVGHQNQVGSIIIGNTHNTESLCYEKTFIANNENIQQNRVYSRPLDAENLRPESSDESEDDSDIDKYVKCSSFRENIRRWAIERNINQIALKDLAKIMNGLIPQILPMDPRTILKTPRCVNIKKLKGANIGITELLII